MTNFVLPGSVIVVLVAALISPNDGAMYSHLGCHADRESPTLRDINGQDITYGTLRLATCLEECRKKGYPYAGLQQGLKCYCGDSYGHWGGVIKPPQSYSACNWTCDNIQCGGILFNSVYYTGRVDFEYTSRLVTVYHEEPMIHVEARRQCVQNGGDLTMMNTTQQIQNASAVIKGSAGDVSGKHVWFGLRNRFWNISVPLYEWVDPTMPAFELSAFTSFIRDAAFQEPCMAFLPEFNQWKAVKCDQAYPYVCRQLPPEDLETSPAPTIAVGEEEEEGGANMLSLYIVLPIFAFCYGGSCIFYCSYKLWKSFRRQKRQKMLLTNMEQCGEYEPGHKPRTVPPTPVRPLSGGKSKVTPAPYAAPRPIHVMPQQQKHHQQTFMNPLPPKPLPPGGPPAIPPPPPPVRKPVSAARPLEQPRKSIDESSRPATSRNVKLVDVEDEKAAMKAAACGRPDSEMMEERPKSRAEKKREKLLENALKEARERRAKERAESTEPPPYSPAPPARAPSQRSAPPPPQTRGKASSGMENDSGDSSTNLLSTAGSDGKSSPPSGSESRMSQDPTQMSIQDILKMKMQSRSAKASAKKKGPISS